MSKLRVRALLVAAVVCCASAIAQAELKTWEFSGNGQWPQVATSAPSTQSSPAPELDRAAELLEQRSARNAEKITIQWLKVHKSHPQRDRALFLIARALYDYGNRIRAFYYCDELLDEYPDSRFFYPALELQYNVADHYLNGYKRRFLGLPMFHAYEEAVEMLYRVQNRSPGSPLAEQSLLRTADFYFADRQYDFAADTYAAYVRSYPRSPQVPRARLREALANYAQFRGPKFDGTPIIDAREQLRALAASYPNLSQEENIPALLEQIDRDLARKLYYTGDFYRRTNEPRGAAYTFKYLTRAFPQAPEAQRAQAALDKLPQWAVASVPEPAIMPEFAPGSPPMEPPRLLPSDRTQTK